MINHAVPKLMKPYSSNPEIFEDIKQLINEKTLEYKLVPQIIKIIKMKETLSVIEMRRRGLF